MTPVIRVDDQVVDELNKRAIRLGTAFVTPNDILRIILGLDSDTHKPERHQKARIVTFKELESKGLINDGQILYLYSPSHGKFPDEQGQVVAASNELKYLKDGKLYAKARLAGELLFKRGLIHNKSIQGPKYWITDKDKVLFDLEEEVRKLRGDRAYSSIQP